MFKSLKCTFLVVVSLIYTNSYSQSLQPCDSISTLNKTVLEIANSQMGKKVKRGECWDLIQYVLDESKANWDGYLSFGKEVSVKKDCVCPGDVVAFSKVKFSGEKEGQKYFITMEKHFGIVKEVLPNNEFLLLHQNFGSSKKVVETTLSLTDLTKGTISFYRPQ